MSVDRTGLPEARLAATSAAIMGDSGGLYHLISGLLDEGMSFDTILFDVLVPTEQDLGARWQSGDYLISEEHAATATVETVVSLLVGSFDQPAGGKRVVVAAAEGDDHSLPGRLVAANLLFRGYRTTFLGGNVLASDLEEYLAIEPPDALALSCAMANHLPGARAAIRASHAAGVPVIVGGKAFGATGKWADLIGADAWVPSPRDVPDVLETWTPDPANTEARAVDPSQDLVDLIGQRPQVLAAAHRELASIGSDNGQPRLVAELSLLLGAVEASLLIGDDQVITDMLHWQEVTLPAHGYDTGMVIATSLKTALSAVSPSATVALARAMGSN